MARLFCPLLLWTCGLFALDPKYTVSQYTQDSWNETAGLPVPSVRVVLQSPDGYIYLGTQNGLFRFNGATFEALPLPAGEPGTHSVSSLVWSGKSLWAGTRGGLFRIENGVASRFPGQDKLPGASILALATDPDGSLWIGTSAGLASYRNGQVRAWTRRDGLAGEQIRRIAADAEGLWLCTLDGGLLRFEQNRFRAYRLADGLPSLQVSDVLRDASGRLWVATNQGMAFLEDGRFRRDTRFPPAKVFNLLEDRHQSLWVAHQDGLTRFHQDRIEHLAWRQDALSTTVWGLLEDRDGSIWFGSVARGLHRLRTGSFSSYGKTEGLTDRLGLVVRPSRRGGVWLGTESGLYYRDEDNLQRFTKTHGLPDDEVTAIAEQPDGSVWVGTAQGLALLKNGRVSTGFGAALDGTTIHDVAFAPGTGLWVGTDAGLWLWDGKQAKNYSPGPGLDSVPVESFLLARDGTLWLTAQNRGLFAYKAGNWRHYTRADGLPSDSVFGLSEDDAGTLWCGGYGLARFDGRRFFAFEKKHGVPPGFVFQAVDDGKGFLWLAGNGVWRFPRKELEAIAAGSRTHASSLTFGKRDGMRSADCVGGESTPAARDSQGRLWFATGRGFATVDPARIDRPWTAVQPEVRAVIAGGRRLAGPDVELPPGTRHVELELDAPSLLAGSTTRFRHRLEGVEPDWVEIGTRRVAVYSALPPGSYRFRLAAATEPGLWQEAAATLVLTQRPHPWQTIWFRLLGGLTVLILAALAYRLRMAHVRQQFELALQERIEERTRIARELHDTVLPELVGAAAQLELVRPALSAPAESHLDRAIETIERAQRDTRSTVWDLRTDELKGPDLPEALQAFGQRHGFPRGIQVDVSSSGDLSPVLPEIATSLYRVGQEAIGNAVRHACPRRISVELRADASSLCLSVIDDGSGFDPSMEVGNKHWGIRGMRERLRRMQGELRIQSSPGNGTKVTAIVPCKPA